MNKSKVNEIILFSFKKFFQNKWFIIFNTISLASIILTLNWGNISGFFNIDQDKDKYKIEIIDSQNFIYDSITNLLENDEKLTISKIEESSYTPDDIPKDVIVLEFTKNEKNYFDTKFISKEGIPTDTYNKIKNALKDIRNQYLKADFFLSEGSLNKIQQDVQIERIMLGVDASNSTLKELIKTFSAAITYLIAVLVFSRIANEIMQEKQSKASEFMLTSVSDKEYLFAKVFSNIAILLIQSLLVLSYYLIALGVLVIFKASLTDLSLSSTLELTPGLDKDIVFYIITLILFNVLSFSLLSIVQGTLAAKTSSSSEAGNTVSILVFVMMILYVITLVLIEPYSKVNIFLYIISVIPILSTYFVPAMMIIGQATTIQIILAFLLLIISIPITFNYCSKKFKEGLLDYSKVKKKEEITTSIHEQQNTYINRRNFKNLGMIVGISIIIYLSTQLIISTIYQELVTPVFGGFLTATDSTLILQGVAQTISILLSYLFLKMNFQKNTKSNDQFLFKNTSDRQSEDKPASKQFNLSKTKIVLMAIALVYILNLLLSIIVFPIFNMDFDIEDYIDFSNSSGLLTNILTILALAILPGILEELLFRKGLITIFEKYGKKFAVIFSALLFGFIHGNFSQGLFAFIVGIIFGTIYISTKDIKLTMIVHAVNNGLAAIAIFLPEAAQMILVIFIFVVIAIGTYYFIKFLKYYGKHLKAKLPKLSSFRYNFKTKYKYLFYDFLFDISIILVIVVSVLSDITVKLLGK